jgi:hypothetical protein
MIVEAFFVRHLASQFSTTWSWIIDEAFPSQKNGGK